MKKKLLVGILAIALILPLGGCKQRDLPLEDTTQLDVQRIETITNEDEVYAPENADEAAMNFAVRLFQMEVAKGNEENNQLISPTSVLIALAMTTNGAEGETLEQIEQVLGISKDELNEYLVAFLENLPEDVKVANSIWYTEDEKFTINENFLQDNEENYGADIKEIAFDTGTTQEINAWVEEKTDGLIEEIITEIPEDAVMYLVNALIFEAEWETVYEEYQIEEDVFTNYEGVEQPVNMMCSRETLYIEDENVTGFIKYYKDCDYAFVALLPDEEKGVYDYVEGMTGEYLQELLSNPIEHDVIAYMPQFEVAYSTQMEEVLQQMGIKDAFDDEKADFSALGTYKDKNIWVDRVIHKTYIEVGPRGTKAGAATVAEILCGAAANIELPKEVKLNRPFIYMIIDCESNQPIFMGIINDIN